MKAAMVVAGEGRDVGQLQSTVVGIMAIAVYCVCHCLGGGPLILAPTLLNIETTFHTRHIGIKNYSGVYTGFFPLCIRHLIQFPYLSTFSCSF
jgi:hypothetical protein